MKNGILHPENYKFCKTCQKEVLLFIFNHIIKHNQKALVILMCSECHEMIGGRFMTEHEISVAFLN